MNVSINLRFVRNLLKLIILNLVLEVKLLIEFFFKFKLRKLIIETLSLVNLLILILIWWLKCKRCLQNLMTLQCLTLLDLLVSSRLSYLLIMWMLLNNLVVITNYKKMIIKIHLVERLNTILKLLHLTVQKL